MSKYLNYLSPWKCYLSLSTFSSQTWRRRKFLTATTTFLVTVIIILQLQKSQDIVHISKENLRFNLHPVKNGLPEKKIVLPRANLSHPVFSKFTKEEITLFENAWNMHIPFKDRTIAQVALIDIVERHHVEKEKVIYTMNNKNPEGRLKWTEEHCPNAPCRFTHNMKEKLDAVIFDNDYHYPDYIDKQPGQTWIFVRLESPLNPQPPKDIADKIDWMTTYWTNSLLVSTYNNYEKRYPRHKGMRIYNFTSSSSRDFSQGKTAKVVWFASNCFATNDRLDYALELGKHIQVDIYGNCGNLTCSRSNELECFEKIRKDYKFYLAFENANCHDYITEKFWRALQYDAIPIVMGAKPEEYLNQAPANSFLHVDDFASAKDLADTLHKLDKDPVLYNKYFEWRQTPGENLEFQQFCRICAMLHAVDWLHKDDRPNQSKTLMKEFFSEKSCVPYWKKRLRYPNVSGYRDDLLDKESEIRVTRKPTTIRPAHRRNRNSPQYR